MFSPTLPSFLLGKGLFGIRGRACPQASSPFLPPPPVSTPLLHGFSQQFGLTLPSTSLSLLLTLISLLKVLGDPSDYLINLNTNNLHSPVLLPQLSASSLVPAIFHLPRV